MFNIVVVGGTLDQKEIDTYVEYVKAKQPQQDLKSLEIHLDGDFVDLKYEFQVRPVERIRRITGYLVGTLDRFNDAKAAEERDRVKHAI